VIETIQLRDKNSRLGKKEDMKRFVYTLFAVLFVTFATYAQEPAEIAVSQGSKVLAESKASGEYLFSLPSNVTKEDVAKSSKYYTHYFTVDFDASSKKVTINMVVNEAKNRFVIVRFLTSCGVRFIAVDGDNVSISDFTEKYLK
jgi:hypothetical protein